MKVGECEKIKPLLKTNAVAMGLDLIDVELEDAVLLLLNITSNGNSSLVTWEL